MRRLLTAITSVEWLILLCVLPLILFPNPQRSLVLLIIPLLWLVRKEVDGRFLPTTHLNTSLLLLSLTLLVSLYASYDLSLSLPKVIGVLYGIALFFAVTASTSRSPRHLQIGLAIFLLAGLGIVLVSIIGTSWGAKLPGFGRLINRIPQLISNVPGATDGFSPNEVAGTLLWFVPLGLTLSLTPHTISRQITTRKILKLFFILFLWGFALFTTVAFILTQSRSGYLAFVAAGFLIIWGVLHHRRRLLWGLVVFIIGSSIGLITLVGWSQISQLFLAFANDAISSEGVTLTGRTEVWERAIYAIRDFPLTGMGMNLFRYIVPVLYPFFAMSTNLDIAHAHNQFLQVGLDLGIPGLIAYTALWLGLITMLWQSWQRSVELWSRFLTVGFAASLVGAFIFGLTDAVALGAKPGFMFWFLLGLITGHYRWLVGATHEDNDS